jgi:hypothetical protein
MNKPMTNEIKLNILIIFKFFNPEYLKILSSLFLKKLIKNICVASKNIKGNISNMRENEFNKDKYKGKDVSTSISLKKSSSLNKFNIIAILNIKINTLRNDFKKTKVINFV